MNRSINTVILMALCLCAPTHANARPDPCPGGPCVERQHPRGTHFLSEFNGGVHLGDEGSALQALLGVGGKPRGFPLRFYLVGEVGYSSIEQISRGVDGGAIQDLRGSLDLAAGLRIYWPVLGSLRLFVDGLLGVSRVDATLHHQGFRSLHSNDFYLAGIMAGGVQYRLIRSLSLGLRLRVTLAEDGLAEPRRALLGSSSTRTSLTGGLTWHF